MAVHDIDVAWSIWDNSVPDLKGNTTSNKPIPMVSNLVQEPEDLKKLHTYINLTADLLFINSIPFFIILRRNTCFTVVNYPANRNVDTILKAFKEIYIYYINYRFHITNLLTYG